MQCQWFGLSGKCGFQEWFKHFKYVWSQTSNKSCQCRWCFIWIRKWSQPGYWEVSWISAECQIYERKINCLRILWPYCSRWQSSCLWYFRNDEIFRIWSCKQDYLLGRTRLYTNKSKEPINWHHCHNLYQTIELQQSRSL